MKRAQTGFSIIELVVTLALAAIVVTIAAPSMDGLQQSGRTASATDTFAISFRYARFEAMQRNTNVKMTSAASGGDWSEGWDIVDSTDKVLRTIPAFVGPVSISSASGFDHYEFNAMGALIYGATDTIKVCDSNAENKPGRQLTISAMGRVTNSKITCSE